MTMTAGFTVETVTVHGSRAICSDIRYPRHVIGAGHEIQVARVARDLGMHHFASKFEIKSRLVIT